jgi:hypothetical protein
MAAKRAFPKAKSDNVFGQRRRPSKMFRVGLYARVSTNDQQTLPMQSRAMREYAADAAGRLLRKSERLAPVQPSEKPARNCWKPPAVERSM